MITGSTTKLKLFNELCDKSGVGNMDVAMYNTAAEIYAKLRKNGTPIDDADIFIAAFCIVNRHVLVTNNPRHFEGIEGLTHVNWK